MHVKVFMDLVDVEKACEVELIEAILSQIVKSCWRFKLSLIFSVVFLVKLYKAVKIGQIFKFISFIKTISNIIQIWRRSRIILILKQLSYFIKLSLNIHLFWIESIPLIRMQFKDPPNILLFKLRHVNVLLVSNDIRNVKFLWPESL